MLYNKLFVIPNRIQTKEVLTLLIVAVTSSFIQENLYCLFRRLSRVHR